jgi:hypothetical protein
MRHIRLFATITGLVILGVILGISLYLFSVNADNNTTSTSTSNMPIPSSIFEGSYEYASMERMFKEANVIVAGKVLSISETKWNQDSGEYWEETFQHNGSETIVGALPYYEITMSVDNLLADSLGVKNGQLTITTIGISPVDDQEEASPFHPKSGDEIVAFVRQGEIGWRGGEIRYNKEDGSIETGRKAALLFMGGPDTSHLLKNEAGLYFRPSAESSPFPPEEELTTAVSIEDLARTIHEERAASS